MYFLLIMYLLLKTRYFHIKEIANEYLGICIFCHGSRLFVVRDEKSTMADGSKVRRQTNEI